MACPDELTLDLWRADALPRDEAAAVAAHVQTCVVCAANEQAAHGLEADLRAALALDAEERAYVSGRELAATWRTSHAAPAVSWAWIVLGGVIAGAVAWFVAAPTFGWAVGVAAQVGVGTLLLHTALGLAFSVGSALIDLIRNPAFSLTQPLLALLALALLIWPRHLIPQRSTHS
jgi:hypothetical protein